MSARVCNIKLAALWKASHFITLVAVVVVGKNHVGVLLSLTSDKRSKLLRKEYKKIIFGGNKGLINMSLLYHFNLSTL